MGSLKKKGPITLLWIIPHQTFTLGLPCWFLKATGGFSEPQMRTLHLLTTPEVWKCASSEKQTRLRQSLSSSIRRRIAVAKEALRGPSSGCKDCTILHFICIQFLGPFVQNLNYCALRYTNLVWGTTLLIYQDCVERPQAQHQQSRDSLWAWHSCEGHQYCQSLQTLNTTLWCCWHLSEVASTLNFRCAVASDCV